MAEGRHFIRSGSMHYRTLVSCFSCSGVRRQDACIAVLSALEANRICSSPGACGAEEGLRKFPDVH